MLEYSALEEIDPDDTVLESVHVDEKNREIRFTYYIGATLDISVEQLLGYGILGISILLIIILVFQNFKALVMLELEQPTIQHNAYKFESFGVVNAQEGV